MKSQANNRTEIKVLYEKVSNIEEMIKRLNSRFDTFANSYTKQCELNEMRFGVLNERTSTLKYFVYGAILTSIGALVGVLINLMR